MSASLALSSSLEDYLETIYWIVQDSQVARVKDIAKNLGVSKPSVTGALRALAAKGLVNYDRYQYITLTDEGKEVAQQLARTHEALRDFLVRVLRLPRPQAEENACRMEHSVDDEVLERIVRYLEFAEACPRRKIRWLDDRGYVCQLTGADLSCERCQNSWHSGEEPGKDGRRNQS